MSVRWLNLYLRYSGYTYGLKQKVVQANSWTSSLPFAVLLMLSELGLVVFSLPLYVVVSPNQLQERGFIFPSKEQKKVHLQNYAVRRRISLTTVFGAGGVFFI